MSPIDLHEERSATERLLERSWEARERRASQRELIVDATAGALFVAVASAVLVLGGGLTGVRSSTAILLIAIYALVGRIEFPVGAGYVVPTQLILVPMLLILPPAAVPLAVGAGMLLGNTVDWGLGRQVPRRVLSAVPDAWHAVGPAVVLVLAGSPKIGFAELPLLAGAFAAGCLLDLASSLVRTRLAGVVPELQLQVRVIALVWAVDATLAPLGFLAGVATRAHESTILFVLPLVFLLWLVARDRRQRIDKAYHRLKLVEWQRVRLQSAVRRLGDALAAKLELESLLEILLSGSIEALDAAAGRLELTDASEPISLSIGTAPALEALGTGGLTSGWDMAPIKVGSSEMWWLNVPLRISASLREITGSLRLARAGRAFEEDEIILVCELVGKAELAAAEIVAHHAIREQAMTDPLTGLGNRRRLTADLSRVFSADANVGASLLLLFDLDGFKDYNDTFGHLAGDELLARLGSRLQQAVAGAGSAYRLGGDEFCAHVILDGADPEALIVRAAAALNETGPDSSIRASFGVVVLPQEAEDGSRALRLADERMYADKRGRSNAACSQATEVLIRTIRARQPELDEHSNHVAKLTVRVARQLGMSGEERDEVARAAQLHDVGKVGMPDAVLGKPGGLSRSEWALVRTHTIDGERILGGAPALRSVARLVRASHECWDGSGYPDGLRGEEIPLGARIISVCDAYSAMTFERAYRRATPHEVACRELRRCAGEQFDPAVVEAFLTVIEMVDDQRGLDVATTAASRVRALLDANAAAAMAA